MEDFIIGFYQALHGLQEDPLWDDVYVTSFYILLFITFISTILYYHVFNRYDIKWFKKKYWVIFMLGNGFIVAVINLIYAINEIQPDDYSSEYLTYFFINIFYALIVFVIFSLVIRFKSPQATFTPFNFYDKKKDRN